MLELVLDERRNFVGVGAGKRMACVVEDYQTRVRKFRRQVLADLWRTDRVGVGPDQQRARLDGGQLVAQIDLLRMGRERLGVRVFGAVRGAPVLHVKAREVNAA